MPKDRKKSNSSSSDRVKLSPYSCNSKEEEKKKNSGNCKKNRMGSCDVEEKDQWEESRCPICMDHPHNAVLLICSSHEKGCRPYMCDTSNLLSNCFDQFCKLHSVTTSKSTTDQLNKFVDCGEKGQELVCPLCRGQISGWIVVEDARKFMNEIIRGCTLDSCDFSGNYVELEKHAMVEHPSDRPSQVNNEQQQNHVSDEVVPNENDDSEDEDEDEDLDGDGDGDGDDEVSVIPLRPDDNFFNHIHFGPEEEVLTEECFVSNGVLHYKRTTTTGKTYVFGSVLGQK